MSLKRLSIGLSLIGVSLALVIPKPEFLGFLNWGGQTLKLILGLGPLLVILYSSFKVKELVKSNPDKESEDIIEEGVEEDFGEKYSKKAEWGREFDIWQGKIKNGSFKMNSGVKDSHFAKRFHSVNINKIEVEAELEDEENSGLYLEIGTNSSKGPMGKLNLEECEESEKFELGSGKKTIEPNIDFKDYSFLKFVLHQESEDVQPEIKKIELES